MADPIFVVGYLHSGTTLLKWILAKDERYYVGSGESAFLDKRQILRSMYPNLDRSDTRLAFLRYAIRIVRCGFHPTFESTGPEPELSELGVDSKTWENLCVRTVGCDSHEEIFVTVFDTLARGAAKESWIEKTPTHLFYLEEILALVPNARIVAIVRDPRAVLASKLRRRRRGRSRSAYDPLWDSLAWASAVRAVESSRNRHPGRVMQVRYERLVSQPEYEIWEVCKFTGIRFDPSMLNVGWLNATVETTADDHTEISDAATHRWREDLPSPDLAMCQLVAKTEMRRLDYAFVHVPLHARLLVPWLLLRSAAEFWGRLYRRTTEAGWPGFRSLMTNYWRRTGSLLPW